MIRKRNKRHSAWVFNKTNRNALEQFSFLRCKVENELKKAEEMFYFSKFEFKIGESRQIYKFLDTVIGKIVK